MRAADQLAPAPCLVAPLLLLAVACGCNFPLFPKANLSRQAMVSVPHEEGAALEAATDNGAIVVATEPREDVQIIASLRSHSQERLDAVVIHAERDTDGRLSVVAEWPDGGRQSHEQCHLRIALPSVEGVSLASRNGSLNLLATAGVAKLQTHNGGVRVVNHEGRIEAHTHNGRIQIAAVGGHPIEAETRNGGVEIEQAGGPVKVITNNGGIDLKLADQAAEPVTAKTSNGWVKLTVGAGFGGTLSVSNTNGELTIDERLDERVVSQTKHDAQLAWDEGDSKSFASATNGAIRIRLASE